MILTCPECATRYFVEDERLGANGRAVRCAGCGHRWRAKGEEPLDLVSDDETGASARDPEPRTFGKAASVEPSPEMTAPELPKAFRAKAEAEKRRRDAVVAGAVWTSLGCAFAGLFAAAFLFRVEIVRLEPRAAGAYAAVGLKVNPTGLEFEEVKAVPAEDGAAVIRVTGKVRNHRREPVSVPPVRAALIDAKGAKLHSATLTLTEGPVAPGAVAAFSLSLPDPQAAAADVDLAFVLDAPAPRPAPAAKAPAPAVVPAVAPAAEPEPEAPASAKAGLRRPEPAALDKPAPAAVSPRPHG